MSNLKLSVMAVLALVSTVTKAGAMGPFCSPSLASVPCPAKGWKFGAEVLYLQATYEGAFGYPGSIRRENLVFVGFDPTNPNLVGIYNQNSSNEYINHQPPWGWGFKVEGRVYFSTGNDLNLNWYHYQHTVDRNDFVSSNITGIWSNYFKDTELESQWDAVNLEFGQHVDFGDYKDIRFHAGVQYARIQRNDASALTLFIQPETFIPLSILDSIMKSNGFGPRIGVDMIYNLSEDVAVYGKGAAALLVGNASFSENYITPIFSNLFPNFAFNGRKTVMIPELEAKLGATYAYAMEYGSLVLDAGYMVTNYFKAIQGIKPLTDHILGNTGVAYSGAYAGVKWIGFV